MPETEFSVDTLFTASDLPLLGGLTRIIDMLRIAQVQADRLNAAMKTVRVPKTAVIDVKSNLGVVNNEVLRLRKNFNLATRAADRFRVAVDKIGLPPMDFGPMLAGLQEANLQARRLRTQLAGLRAPRGPAVLGAGGGGGRVPGYRGPGGGGGRHRGFHASGGQGPVHGFFDVGFADVASIAAVFAGAHGIKLRTELIAAINKMLTGIGRAPLKVPERQQIWSMVQALSGQLGAPISEVAAGMYAVQQQLGNLSMRQRLAITPSMIRWGQVEHIIKGIPLGEAVSATAELAHQWGKYKFREIQGVQQQIAGLSTLGYRINIPRLVSTMSYAAFQARTAGIGMTTVAGITAAAMLAGVKNTKGGTWLAGLIENLYPKGGLIQMLTKRGGRQKLQAMEVLGLVGPHGELSGLELLREGKIALFQQMLAHNIANLPRALGRPGANPQDLALQELKMAAGSERAARILAAMAQKSFATSYGLATQRMFRFAGRTPGSVIQEYGAGNPLFTFQRLLSNVNNVLIDLASWTLPAVATAAGGLTDVFAFLHRFFSTRIGRPVAGALGAGLAGFGLWGLNRAAMALTGWRIFRWLNAPFALLGRGIAGLFRGTLSLARAGIGGIGPMLTRLSGVIGTLSRAGLGIVGRGLTAMVGPLRGIAGVIGAVAEGLAKFLGPLGALYTFWQMWFGGALNKGEPDRLRNRDAWNKMLQRENAYRRAHHIPLLHVVPSPTPKLPAVPTRGTPHAGAHRGFLGLEDWIWGHPRQSIAPIPLQRGGALSPEVRQSIEVHNTVQVTVGREASLDEIHQAVASGLKQGTDDLSARLQEQDRQSRRLGYRDYRLGATGGF